MGLEEKRYIKTLTDEVIPTFKNDLKAIIGKDVDLAMNWDTFSTSAQLQEVQHQCLGRILDGIRKIAADDMGKEALSETLATIKINNVSDSAAKKIELSGNTLTVDAKWEDFSSGIFTDTDYSTQIEKAL